MRLEFIVYNMNMQNFYTNRYLSDFPILSRKVHGDKRLVYLDSAATSQKPQAVIDAISDYYTNHNANVHRGIHVLGDESTRLFLEARRTIAAFFGADDEELVLVRNTTEALNLVAYAWGDAHIKAGDVILTTEMEHHSNLVPWQELCKRTGAELKFIPVGKNGLLDISQIDSLLTDRVKVLTLTHISNVLGTVNDIKLLTKKAHGVGAVVVVDGAQSAPHLPILFHDLDVDFFACSGHKMLGPMGIGCLFVRKSLLENMHPHLFGGGMIDEVYLDHATYAPLPDAFIAGTPDVASTVGLAAACQYLSKIGMQNIYTEDAKLVAYALEQLSQIPELTLIGPLNPTRRVGSVAFIYNGVHAHDVAQVLDSEGVAVRSGHHCAMPLHTKFGWQATVRASFGVYSTHDDIDVLVTALAKVKKIFA